MSNELKMDEKCFYSGNCLSNCLCLFSCVLSFDFVSPKIKKELKSTVYSFEIGKQRDKEIIRILEKRCPPRVSEKQVNRYYNHLRITGVDLDRVPFTLESNTEKSFYESE